MLCYLLHTRDRRVLANRSAPALPVADVATADPSRPGNLMGQYLPIVCCSVLATLFGALSFFASRLLAPRRPSSAKEAPYECGIVPESRTTGTLPGHASTSSPCCS